jgi:putative protease
LLASAPLSYPLLTTIYLHEQANYEHRTSCARGQHIKTKYSGAFRADAVYFGGQDFGLRAFSDNFTNEEIAQALKYLHSKGKKGYITANIFPKNSDFGKIKEFLQFIEGAGADGVIISDAG